MYRERIIYTLCTIAVMTAIFLFSSQTGKQTMDTSDIIVVPIENNIKTGNNKTFETEKEETAYWKKIKDTLDAGVRKTAHITVFFILSVCVFLTLKSWNIKGTDAIALTLLICALYAGSDELHQKFINGRNARFTDICIDEFGAVIFIIIMWCGERIKGFRAKKVNKKRLNLGGEK